MHSHVYLIYLLWLTLNGIYPCIHIFALLLYNHWFSMVTFFVCCNQWHYYSTMHIVYLFICKRCRSVKEYVMFLWSVFSPFAYKACFALSDTDRNLSHEYTSERTRGVNRILAVSARRILLSPPRGCRSFVELVDNQSFSPLRVFVRSGEILCFRILN